MTAIKDPATDKNRKNMTIKEYYAAASAARNAPATAPKPKQELKPTATNQSQNYVGKRDNLGAALDVLNPFSSGKVYLGNSNIDVGAPVRTIVRTGEAALALSGIGALASKIPALAKTATAATAAVKPTGNILKDLIFGGVGFVAGMLTGGKSPVSQVQQPNQTTNTTTNTTSIQKSKSINTSYQDVYNVISQSPGSSLSSTASQIPTITSEQLARQEPRVEVTPYISESQGVTQDNFLIPALIVAGIILLKK